MNDRVKGLYILKLDDKSRKFDLLLAGMLFVSEILYGKDYIFSINQQMKGLDDEG